MRVRVFVLWLPLGDGGGGGGVLPRTASKRDEERKTVAAHGLASGPCVYHRTG